MELEKNHSRWGNLDLECQKHYVFFHMYTSVLYFQRYLSCFEYLQNSGNYKELDKTELAGKFPQGLRHTIITHERTSQMVI